MTIAIKPEFEIEIADDPDAEAAGALTPSRYNQGSKLSLAVQRLIGRVQAETETEGEAQEISVLAGLLLNASGLGIDKATAANIRSRTSNKVLTGDNIASAKAAVTLAYSATRSLVWTDGWYRTCTLTGNMTIANPTSVEAGDTIVLYLTGSNATERSIAWGTNYKGALPEVTVTSSRSVVVFLFAVTTSLIVVSHVVVE